MENEIIQNQSYAPPVRKISVITAEVLEIRRQAQNMALMYAIEIGRRLVEAKSVLNHGEWGSWLHNEVEFSQSTANNFMRLYEEYGNTQLSIFGETPNSQTIGNLPYSKALMLLSLPADEREEFAAEENAAEMTTRELKQAIEERNQAIKEKEEAERRAFEIEEKSEQLERATAEANEASAEAQRLKSKLEEYERDIAAASEREKKLKTKLKDAQNNPKLSDEAMKKITSAAEETATIKVRNESLKEIEDLKNKVNEAEERARLAERRQKESQLALEEAEKKLKTANPDIASFKTLFDEIQKTAKTLKSKIESISQTDPDLAEKLKAAVTAFGKTL